MLVEPDHPVPQRLTVHPTDLGGIFPQSAVEHCRDRQQSACLRGILRPLGHPADLAGRVKSVRTASAWPMANDPPFATLNQFAADLWISARVRHSEGWYNISAFWLNIFLSNISQQAYGLGLKSKMVVDFRSTKPHAVEIRCDGPKEGAKRFKHTSSGCWTTLTPSPAQFEFLRDASIGRATTLRRRTGAIQSHICGPPSTATPALITVRNTFQIVLTKPRLIHMAKSARKPAPSTIANGQFPAEPKFRASAQEYLTEKEIERLQEVARKRATATATPP